MATQTTSGVTRLRRANCNAPGWSRRRRGKGFEYQDQRGSPLRDEEALERVRALAIPPAWVEVWICPEPNGHLQAVGTDAAGRKQYLYHERWRIRRDLEKFERMVRFAHRLPDVRERAERDLAARGLPRERVLACAVRLLDRASFRVGGESYLIQNGSFGLATLRKRHVHVSGETLSFDYIAKGGKRRKQSVSDPELAKVVRTLKRRSGGGGELLAWKDGTRWRDVRSVDINDYLKELAGEEFSAKDFRTWHATVLAAVTLVAGAAEPNSATSRARVVQSTIKSVAEFHGNTPAVSRASYVDPRVIDLFMSGSVADLGDLEADEVHNPGAQPKLEMAVLDLLEGRRSSSRAA
jgi:DNA topoisomerase-1